MDKNHIIGFVLIFAVMIGFTYFGMPSDEERAAQQRYNDSIYALQLKAQEEAKLAQEKAIAAEIDSAKAALADTTSLFADSKRGTDEVVTLKNEKVTLNLQTKGAYISSAVIAGYEDYQKNPVELFDAASSSLSFELGLKEENIRTLDRYFVAENVSDSTVTFRLKGKDGSALALDYKLLPGTYMVNFTVRAEGNLERHCLPGKNQLHLTWKDQAKRLEKGTTFENRYATLTYMERNEGTDYLNESQDKEEQPEGTLDWVAFKNQFFSYVLINYEGMTDAYLHSTPLQPESGYLKRYTAQMQTAFDPTGQEPTRMQFYIGPNNFRLLQSMNDYTLDATKDLELEQLVYLGWPLFRWINRWFTIYVFDWFTGMGLPIGIVLLLITVLLKVIVYPTTRKSFLSSAKMRVLRPKIDEINEKYPNPEDNMKKQQEIMQLYSSYGANPMGGCLPMLLQMPIWIAMFNFVPNAIELRGEGFLWADDLSTYDDIISWNTSLPLIGDHISLFCLLFCGSNLIYSWINLRMQRDTMAAQGNANLKMMQWMMMLMPLFFFFIFNDYSAGLNYYYFISLLGSVVVMWYLRWSTDDAKLLAKLEANYEKNKNNPQKARGMAARLEALQKAQEARLRQERERRKR